MTKTIQQVQLLVVVVAEQQQQQLGDSDRGSDSVDAAGMVVLEWAQKLCDQQFGSVSQLAEFLIQKQYVSSRSLHAFSVMTAAAIKSNSTISGLLPAGTILWFFPVVIWPQPYSIRPWPRSRLHGYFPWPYRNWPCGLENLHGKLLVAYLKL